MEQFTNIIICMDDTERDAPMLAYMVPLIESVHTRNVTLLHVHNPDSDPHSTSVIPHSDSMWEVPVTPSADITERTRDRMIALAHTYLSSINGVNWQTIISDEPEITEILAQAARLDADLIVIGRHYDDFRFKSSQAVTARRVTERATCSVLILPESAPPCISSIVVPVRNSECSAVALRAAYQIGLAFNARIEAVNLFRAATKGNFEKSKRQSSHMQLVKEMTQKENEALLKRVELTDTHITPLCLPSVQNDAVTTILSHMAKTQCDLVAIGARGRTGAAGIFLGAVTEELIQRSPVPVLAIKTKGECVDILHALLSLIKRD
ncbi:MAG: universal stress protein [Deltaproteobacteria bacterium]|nr:universal stress protein [Deltaproteobacteria bacterium]